MHTLFWSQSCQHSSCSVCVSMSATQLFYYPTHTPKIVAAALVTTLHETNKVARCHFENGCFSKVKKSHLWTSHTPSIDVLERPSSFEWHHKSQQSYCRLLQPCGDTLRSARVWGFPHTAAQHVCVCGNTVQVTHSFRQIVRECSKHRSVFVVWCLVCGLGSSIAV